MEKAVIHIQQLNKFFGIEHVLTDINASFSGGNIYGIIGRNGSGKTVLFKCICGLMPYTSGSISVNGKTVGKEIDIPENIGAIIESPGFLNNYDAYTNLKFLARLNGKAGPEEIHQALEETGLSSTGKKKVKKFSMGMRQRLGIAQAIMEAPDILILDEPMNGLDNQGVKDIRKLLLKMKEKGTLILLASHNREDIVCLCNEVYEMDAGILTRIGKEI